MDVDYGKVIDMKKYILLSSLITVFFPLIMVYPLFFLGLFILNPLFVVTKITGTDAAGLVLALLVWVIVGGLVGYLIFSLRRVSSSKKNLPLPSFNFSAIVLTILIQLVVTYAISYLV